MEISKSTPYVRYRENISSSLHKGTVHIESEYLDRGRKTTIETIEGQTWQNLVVNENKELEMLGVGSIGLSGDIYDTGEKRLAVDVVMGNATPTVNEDGTYTYSVSTMEGEYARTFDGVNHITSTSDGLDGEFHIKYNTQGEEIIGNFSMNGEESHINVSSNGLTPLADISYKMHSTTDVVSGTSATIEDGKDSDMVEGVVYGETLVNRAINGSQTYECAEDIIVSGEVTNYVELDGTVPTSDKLELSIEADGFILADKFVLNKILDVNNKGVVTDATNEVATVDYLPIPAKEFTFKTTSMSGINYVKGAFYDKDKVYINRFGNGNGTSSYTVTVPSNAVYMRIGYYITNSTTSPFETNKHWIKLANVNTQEYYWDDLTVKNPIVVVGLGDSSVNATDVTIPNRTLLTMEGTIEEKVNYQFEGDTVVNIFHEDLDTASYNSLGTCAIQASKNNYTFKPTQNGDSVAYSGMGAQLKANTTYTLKYYLNRTSKIKFVKDNIDGGVETVLLTNNSTFTVSEAGYYHIRFYIYGVQTNWSILGKNFMVLEGDLSSNNVVYSSSIANVCNQKLTIVNNKENLFNERYFIKKEKVMFNGVECYRGAGSIPDNSTFQYGSEVVFPQGESMCISFDVIGKDDNCTGGAIRIQYTDTSEEAKNFEFGSTPSRQYICSNPNKKVNKIFINRYGGGYVYINNIAIAYESKTSAPLYTEPNHKIVEPCKNFVPVLEEEAIANIFNNMGYSNVAATYSNGKFTLTKDGNWGDSPNKVWKLKPRTYYTTVIEGANISWATPNANPHAIYGGTDSFGGEFINTSNGNKILYHRFKTDDTGIFGYLTRFTPNVAVTFKIYEGNLIDLLPLHKPIELNKGVNLKDVLYNNKLIKKTGIMDFKSGMFRLDGNISNEASGFTAMIVRPLNDLTVSNNSIMSENFTNSSYPCVNPSGGQLNADGAREECIAYRSFSKNGVSVIIKTSRIVETGTPTSSQCKQWLIDNMTPIAYDMKEAYFQVIENIPISCLDHNNQECNPTLYQGQTILFSNSSYLANDVVLKDTHSISGADYAIAKASVELKEVNGVRDVYDYKNGRIIRNIGTLKFTKTLGYIYNGAGLDTINKLLAFTLPLTDLKVTPRDVVVKCNDDRFTCLSNANRDAITNRAIWGRDIAYIGFRVKYGDLGIADTEDISTYSVATLQNKLKENVENWDLTIDYIKASPTYEMVAPTIISKEGAKLQAIPTYNIATKLYGASETVNLLMKYNLDLTSSIPLQGVSANKQYTICYDRVGTANLSFKIGETRVETAGNKTLITPTTSSDKMLLIGSGNTLSNIMLIEGDVTNRELPYFEGLISVENPLVTVSNGNLWGQVRLSESWDDYSHDAYGTSLERILKLEPNTKYRINNILRVKGGQIVFNLLEKQVDGSYRNLFSQNRTNHTNDVIEYTVNSAPTTTTGDIYLQFYPCSSESSFRWGMETIKRSSLTIFKDGAYENNTMIEPESSHLTTSPQITLHGIGNVKDEWDMVNETVTRRIGEVLLDGETTKVTHFRDVGSDYATFRFHYPHKNPTNRICDKLPDIYSGWTTEKESVSWYINNEGFITLLKSKLGGNSSELANAYLSNHPVRILYLSNEMIPTTESVRITPQNPKTSTASITINEPLNAIGTIHDKLRWNPYKGCYVRYNHIVDDVAYDQHRTIENLHDLGERQYVDLYEHRTYFLPTNGSMESRTHGTSVYCLAEQGKQYCVRWDWIESPTVNTIKVDLCGNIKEVASTENSVVIDVVNMKHSFVQLQGNGLQGKFTNLMVIETVDGEIPDVDFFSGVKAIGNTVQIDGTTKVQIDVEQTNGNLIDGEFTLFNNGNYISYDYFTPKHINQIKPNKDYIVKMENGKSVGDAKLIIRNNNEDVYTTSPINRGSYSEYIFKTPYNAKTVRFYAKQEGDGSANVHYPIELCYADMVKDGIRPRYHDMKSFIIPMKLCRVGEVYDNLYYDDLKGYYRIQQSIGHKYFTGDTSERWEMGVINLNNRTVAFTYKNGDINQLAMGDTICNGFKRLKDVNQDTEGFIIYNGDFVLRIDKERIEGNCSIDGLRAYLSSYPIHLFYQLKTPQMVDLPQYPNRLELNTYRDEVFTFIKDSNPTKFTLSIPMDRAYRFDDHQEGQGLANRVSITDERISSENVVAIQEIRGKGIANLIEDPNNVPVTPLPNYSGVATSHQLTNTKPSIVHVHGFEPSGDTKIGTWNVADKKYQIKVMSGNSNYSLSDYYVLDVPYQLETYPDGTKDRVCYNAEHQEWQVNGSYDRTIAFNASTGAFTEAVEIFRGMTPRSGMIAEFKLRFTSGTTTARLYYSVNGSTYSYVTLRGMVDDQDYYLAFFNTGGTKIDYSTKVGATTEYASMTALSATIPEGLFVNQIQSLTECTHYVDKFYQYPTLHTPIELDTYDGTTNIYIDGKTTDTNIIINNDCFQKVVNTYEDVEYTVYWKYLSGDGKLTITLGGTRVEVDGTKGYATIRTQLQASQELVYIGGYNLSIQDVMVVKGARIDELAYFEGSRQVGTLVVDEHGNKQYKITLVQGGSVLEQKDYDKVEFKDDNKHNVVVHKIVGVRPTKVD